MKHIRLAIVLVSGISIINLMACKSNKGASAPAPAPPAASQPAPAPSPAPAVTTASVTPKSSGTSRYIASFYSTGGGIDLATHDAFMKFLQSHPKKIAYEPKRWGREGEVDYCLALNELTSAEQEEFVFQANRILQYNIHIIENSKSQHKSSAPADEKYRLVVSFFSIGEGVNKPVADKFLKFVAEYSTKVKYESFSWGREGEVDYCFKLSELSPSQQDEFVLKAKDILAKKVRVSENASCPR